MLYNKACNENLSRLGFGCMRLPQTEGGEIDMQEMEKMVTAELGDSGEILYRKQIAATLALNTGPGLIGVAAILDP